MSNLNKLKSFIKNLNTKTVLYVRKNLAQIVVFVLIVIFIIIFFWPRIVITIQAGHAGVLYRPFSGGTVVTKVYGEGINIIWPWNKMTIYNVRIQNKPHEMNVISKNGLRIKIHLAIRYHPIYPLLGELHQLIGPDYVEKIVIPEVETSTRKVIGRFNVNNIYTVRPVILQMILNDSKKDASQEFIKINNVLVTKVELPEFIQESIEKKIEQKELSEAYEFRLEREEKEAKRKEIEARGIKTYNDIIAKSLSEDILRWKGVEATLGLSASDNAKVVIIGSGGDGLPIILDTKP